MRHGAALLLTVVGISMSVGCAPAALGWPPLESVELQPSPSTGRYAVLPSAYEAFIKGQLAYYEADFAGAELGFKSALRTDPHSAYLHAWVAKTYLERDRLSSAQGSLTKALEHGPCNEFALNVAAEVLVAQGDPDGAMGTYRRAIDCEPRRHEAYLALGELLERSGASDRARQVYEELLAISPSADARDRLSQLALDRDDPISAAAELSALLELEPWRAEALQELARLSLARGQTVRARALAEALVSQRPRSWSARSLLARIHLSAGDREGARRVVRYRPAGDQDMGRMLPELAEILLLARDFDGAADAARRALSVDATAPRARFVLGAALRHLGGLEEAASVLAQVPATATDWGDRAAVEGAQIHLDRGDVAAARGHLERFLRRHEAGSRSRQLLASIVDDAAAEVILRGGTGQVDRLGLARWLVGRARVPEAVEVLRAIDDPTVEGSATLAWALLLSPPPLQEEGHAASAAVLERAPGAPEAMLAAGVSASVSGDHELAISRLVRASNRRPGWADALGELSLALVRAGRCADATDTAARALRLSPSPRIRAALASLGC